MSNGITVRVPDRPRNEAEYEAAREAVRAGRDFDRWTYFGDREVREVAGSCPAVGVDRERFLRALAYGPDGEPPTEKDVFTTPAGRNELGEAAWLADTCRTLAEHLVENDEGPAWKLRELAGVCEFGVDVEVRPGIGR